MNEVTYEQAVDRAVDESKKGGDTDKAMVFAMLAVAAAIREVADCVSDVAHMGSEAQPVHVREA